MKCLFNNGCDSLVKNFQLVESFNRIVRVDDAEVENVAKKCKCRKHLTKLQEVFICKEKDQGTDEDPRVGINCTANVLDVDIGRE